MLSLELVPPTSPQIGRPARIGFGALVIGFGGFLLWATMAQLASGVAATGNVVVQHERKVVQHAEGGIISALLVNNGDLVRKGQVLLRLDSVDSSGKVIALRAQWLTLLADEARLISLVDGKSTLQLPDALKGMMDDPQVSSIIQRQERLLGATQRSVSGQLRMIDQQIAQQRALISSLQAQIARSDEQIDLIDAEAQDLQDLFKKGLERKPRLNAMKRQAAYLESAKADLTGQIATAKEAIAGASLEKEKVIADLAKELSMQLSDTTSRRIEIEEELNAANAAQGRRDVLAPQDGNVLNMHFSTIGGVISPGEEILEIVPVDERLVVDAAIDPRDIDQVHSGLPAKVLFTGLNRRLTPTLTGKVYEVSADSLEDKATGRRYFSVKVEIGDVELARLGDGHIQAGMPAQVVVETGSRTPMDYLLSPLREALMRAMRET